MNAEALDDGMTSCVAAAMVWYLLQQVTLCGCLYSCWYRKKLRSRFNLPERPLPDILVHYCCWPCAICQEYREIQHRSSGPPLLYTTPPEEQTFAERTWHA
ncbi:hypothetical protein O6H91_13G058700 [Diphasiastrum complanatum]|nr:hypothetical protein O6H91_13G058700 [Diphasiastrum complanatum]